jgi:CRISPR system Cascade subunit CasE
MNNDPVCWLTRAIVSPRTLIARGLHDTYAWHQLVWQAFPGRDGQTRDFLTRLDEKPGGTQLLIVSPVQPVRPPWITDADVWESRGIPPSYFQARRYRFQLRANPTHKPLNDPAGNYIADPKKRKRRAITGQPALVQWLERKGAAGGFRVAETACLTTWQDVQRFSKHSPDGRLHNGCHSSVDFSGILEVTDPVLFLNQTFTKGLGSAKAFGFGLLVLAPAS